MGDDGTRPERYKRSRTDRVIAGVCGGLASYLELDPTLVRVAWVVVTIFSAGVGIAAYLLLWLLAPEERLGRPSQTAETTSAEGSSE